MTDATLEQMEEALTAVEGMVLVMEKIASDFDGSKENTLFRYLGGQLRQHFLDAWRALEQMKDEAELAKPEEPAPAASVAAQGEAK